VLWLEMVILATWEVEMGRLQFESNMGKELVRTPVLTNKNLGMVGRACNPVSPNDHLVYSTMKIQCGQMRLMSLF
jgi:hypothetical protein